MSEKNEQLSPMLAHWRKVKDSLDDTLVFYRTGDFYELFFEDAIVASRELDLVLTGKNAGLSEKAPMCGVPHKAVNTYIQKSLQLGHKVAIVEQLEDPKTAKGMVKRDVIRIVTPGTFVDVEDDKTTITIASIMDSGLSYIFTIVDLASGSINVRIIDHNLLSLIQTIKFANVKECVLLPTFNKDVVNKISELSQCAISYYEDITLKKEYNGLLNNNKNVFIANGLALVVNYLLTTQKTLVSHLQIIEVIDKNKVCQLDYNTLVNLELTENIRQQAKTKNLWTYLDHCQSALGSRLLKKWIENPLVEEKEINKRLDMVTYLVDNLLVMDELKNNLSHIYDIARLCSRLAMNSANALDLLRLCKTLQVLPAIKQCLNNEVFADLLNFECFQELAQKLDSAILENPSINLNEGNIIKDGYNQQLDYIRHSFNDNKKWLLDFEAQQKEITGIKNLRVVYSRNFGYCIEISKGQLSLVKDEYGYIRRQTLTNVERFTCQQLKEHEDLIINGQQRAINLEKDLFIELKDECASHIYAFQQIASCIGAIDCIYALSVVSSAKGFIRPSFSDNNQQLINAKHPLLDELCHHNSISNDSFFSDDKNIVLITGPNMGGKSTYMRTIAITNIMAQIGCYVLASKAVLPIYDAIYTRIGASDDILSGQSTFMVEMNEANYALVHATKKSLILFDELGRGTSTYDGMALAYAMIEYIAKHIGCHTLFSTHYHELTSISNVLDNVINVHAKVSEVNDTISFTYKVVKGKADKSYGIHVAKVANLPDSVINKANVMVNELENKQHYVQPSFDLDPIVETKTIVKESETLKSLKNIDINTLTPLQALSVLDQLKTMAINEDNHE